jgi:hypothetical protein
MCNHFCAEILKNSSGEITASSIATSFNNFVAQITAIANLTPKLINVTIASEDASSMTLSCDVDFGNGPMPSASITFPTTDATPTAAANLLSTTINGYLQDPNYQGAGAAFSPADIECRMNYFYWYNVSLTSPLCFRIPTISELPDPLLWTAAVANGMPSQNLFKAIDYPKYFNNLQIMAQSNTLLNSSNPWGTNMKTIKISLQPVWVVNGSTIDKCGSLNDGINGYVHAISSIFMANLGCLPYSY